MLLLPLLLITASIDCSSSHTKLQTVNINPSYVKNYSFHYGGKTGRKLKNNTLRDQILHLVKLSHNSQRHNKRNTDENPKSLKSEQQINMTNLKTVIYEDIPHYKVEKSNKDYRKVMKIESEFKKLLSMREVTYEYKRDLHWRTWRNVQYPNGTDITVYHKNVPVVDTDPRCTDCNNFSDPQCIKCMDSSMWVLDPNPPCPYEIFSMQSKHIICAVHAQNFYHRNFSCTSPIELNSLLATCDNPIKTKWRVAKNFRREWEKQNISTVICGDKHICEFVTVYEIENDLIVFKIIDEHETVIYSRVMKENGENFACVRNCGGKPKPKAPPKPKKTRRPPNRVGPKIRDHKERFPKKPRIYY